MPSKKPQPLSVTQNITGDNNIAVAGTDNTVTVNQTIIQKFFNIFKSDAETVDQRNRRIMLGHVESFWVKGILEKSLHGAALLDLGIKEDPNALKYPWAIKREATKETLPAGTSMLEIFQEIGLGRSLLILGAPGSGKTTMLLELTRQLIERAREDVTEPIPVVFNLSSWTEKFILADWLARELNVIYTIPKKVAPTWVKENKILLLLDGLDEVRQESRDKCVDAINQFRKENGLTSMAVCSRIQDYAELKTRLSFDGAIEIQPLTSNQVDEYFNRYGKGLARIKQILEKDTILREMAETPLFLSIMMLAYRGFQKNDIPLITDPVEQRKYLFDAYIRHMFERETQNNNFRYDLEQIKKWINWLAKKMVQHNQSTFMFEDMKPDWLSSTYGTFYKYIFGFVFGLVSMFIFELFFLFQSGLIGSLVLMVIGGMILGIQFGLKGMDMFDTISLEWKTLRGGLWFGIIIGEIAMLFSRQIKIEAILGCVLMGLILGLTGGLKKNLIDQTSFPGQRIFYSIRNFFLVFLLVGPFFGFFIGIMPVFNSQHYIKLTEWLNFEPTIALKAGIAGGVVIGLTYGGYAVIQHYILRLILSSRKLLPWKLIAFLNHCTDLVFLRRVGGGYIFVHRLLMVHFAAMYPEET